EQLCFCPTHSVREGPVQYHHPKSMWTSPSSLTESLDLLYEEALYTVVNRVGVPPPEHVKSDEELPFYLFFFSQRASFSLRVSVMKAKNLMAKDANGYSDPYCMLGILDPFVIVELCPHHLFPMAKSQRTQVKLKTLHPVFDELFYL
uniref:BAI1 associated protein 3 n=1 Tax=Anabas testudineus TaxID=64144 RepID=A0AAQ6IR28_ANATE